MDEGKGSTRVADLFADEFRKQLADEPARVELPLIDPATGKPLVCYVFPLTTVESDALRRAQARGGVELIIETVVQRVRDRDRKRLISDADRVTIRMESMADTIAECALRVNAQGKLLDRAVVGK